MKKERYNELHDEHEGFFTVTDRAGKTGQVINTNEEGLQVRFGDVPIGEDTLDKESGDHKRTEATFIPWHRVEETEEQGMLKANVG